MIQSTRRAMREARTFGLEARVAVLQQEIERLQSLLREAADHIDGSTGARSRPESDSGELVARMDAAIGQSENEKTPS